tara:strand:+ start:45955 stop:46890 length:936 start_codon:yes stop_codon:yes gene_type:complete
MGKIDKTGLLYALSSYLFWGTVPFYFWAVKEVSSLEVLSHRVLWSVVCLAAILRFQKRLIPTLKLLFNKKVFLSMLVTGSLMVTNWLIFIHAISSGQTLESSFGYFILPLISIALGFLVLGEKLSRSQFVALFLASLGVIYQIVLIGELPWIALGLAITFGIYGLIRKQVKVGPIQGVFLEATIVLPVAALALYVQGNKGLLVFGEDLHLTFLLSLAGFMTFIPLWLFSEGAKRIPLSANGFLQFMTPTIHFFVAIVSFNEPLDSNRLVSFALVWVGLAIMVIFPLMRNQIQSYKSRRSKKLHGHRGASAL